MNLTAEQRAALENAIDWLTGLGDVKAATRPETGQAEEIYRARDVLRNILTTPKPAWKITEERKSALHHAINGVLSWPVPNDDCADVLRVMLEEDGGDEISC